MSISINSLSVSLLIFVFLRSIAFGGEAPVVNNDKPCTLCKDLPSLAALSETLWLKPCDRTPFKCNDEKVTNHDGKLFPIRNLWGRPTALTFVYTHCSNPNKCPLVASTMAALQRALQEAGLETRVRLCIMTYDPTNDSALTLKEYAKSHGIAVNENFMTLRPEVGDKKALFEGLGISVNYDNNQVNIHGIQLLIIDSQGRLVKTYHTLLWKNKAIIDNFKMLLDE